STTLPTDALPTTSTISQTPPQPQSSSSSTPTSPPLTSSKPPLLGTSRNNITTTNTLNNSNSNNSNSNNKTVETTTTNPTILTSSTNSIKNIFNNFTNRPSSSPVQSNNSNDNNTTNRPSSSPATQPTESSSSKTKNIPQIYNQRLSLGGAKIADFKKNYSNGYISSMTSITRSKIWTGDSQGHIVTWSISLGGEDKHKQGSQWKGHNGTISSLVYLPTQKIVFSSGHDGKIIAWNKTDYSPLHTFETKDHSAVYDMIEINSLLFYCCGNSSSIFIIDTNNIKLQPREILLNDVLNNEVAVKYKNRKIIKLIPMPEQRRLVLCTNRGEIIIFNTQDKMARDYYSLELNEITSINVVGDNLWIGCVASEGTTLFSNSQQGVITIFDPIRMRVVRSFNSQQPVSQFIVCNGFIWAISRSNIYVYESGTGQFPMETIELTEDMNFKGIYSFHNIWIGGTHLWRFRIIDQWVTNNLNFDCTISNIDTVLDYYDLDKVDQTLELIKNRLQLEHSNEIYDVLLSMVENELLSTDFYVRIVVCFGYFCRNKSTLTRKHILSDSNRIYRITQFLSNCLEKKSCNGSAINSAQLVLESIKALDNLCLQFGSKFIKLLRAELISNFTTLEFKQYKVLIKHSLSIIEQIVLHSNGKVPNCIKDKLKQYMQYIQDPIVDDRSKQIIFSIINRLVNETFIKEYFKKESNTKSILSMLMVMDNSNSNNGADISTTKNTPSSLIRICLYTPETLLLFKLLFKEYPKLLLIFGQEYREFITNLTMILDKIQLDSEGFPIEPIINLVTSSTTSNLFIQSQQFLLNAILPLGREGKKKSSKKLSASSSGIVGTSFESPIHSVIFTLNSILKSIQNTSLKTAKVKILDIIVPESFPMDFISSLSASIVKLNLILPKQSFQSTIQLELAPNISVKLYVSFKGLSGEAEISDVSLKGQLTLGFEHGTATPSWIQFQNEPEINFKFNSPTGIIKIGEFVIRPVVTSLVKKKFVYPNKFYLPSL
ncbi:hypothetical protein CYY_008707, partial [Polysphondylium violaceum]